MKNEQIQVLRQQLISKGFKEFTGREYTEDYKCLVNSKVEDNKEMFSVNDEFIGWIDLRTGETNKYERVSSTE